MKESVNTIFDRVSLDESMETLMVGSTVGPAVKKEIVTHCLIFIINGITHGMY